MSYLPNLKNTAVLATPASFVIIPSLTATLGFTLSTGMKAPLSSPQVMVGSWTPTITNDTITLPSGYYYYLEMTQQVYYSGTATNSAYAEQMWYNESSSSYIGTAGRLNKTTFEDTLLTSYDEVACAFLDATSSSIDVSAKIKSFTGFQELNYSSGQSPYGGFGRQLIWQLYP